MLPLPDNLRTINQIKLSCNGVQGSSETFFYFFNGNQAYCPIMGIKKIPSIKVSYHISDIVIEVLPHACEVLYLFF